MTTHPHAPRLRKGALVGVDPFNPLASLIVFQYNPATLRRELSARRGEKTTSLRITGAPKETFSLELILDATDQLERGDAQAESLGVLPQLAALEMLLHPKSTEVLLNLALAMTGSLELMPSDVRMTLFVWGPKRVLPVQVTGYSVTEERFDSGLNPVHAKVKLELDVLSYSDLGWTHPGSYVYLLHQVAKEVMATSAGNESRAHLGEVMT